MSTELVLYLASVALLGLYAAWATCTIQVRDFEMRKLRKDYDSYVENAKERYDKLQKSRDSHLDERLKIAKECRLMYDYLVELASLLKMTAEGIDKVTKDKSDE